MMGSKCAYCGVELGQMACKSPDGKLYCSAVCMGMEVMKPNWIDAWESRVNWWVCRMKRSNGYFSVGSWDKPEGRLSGDSVNVAADSYEVVYGPCSKADADAYLEDVTA